MVDDVDGRQVVAKSGAPRIAKHFPFQGPNWLELAGACWSFTYFNLSHQAPALGLSLNWFGLQGQRLVLMSSSEQYPLTRHVHF